MKKVYFYIDIKELLLDTIKISIFTFVLAFLIFSFIKNVNAEMIDSSFTVSYVSPTTTSKFNDMIILGNSYSGARIGFNQTLDYYVVDYTYRMSTPGRKYNVYFMVISTSGSMPVFTLNNQACEVFVATENDLATVGGGVINGQVFNVACVNIDPDPNNFQIVVRHNIKNINNGYLYYYGVKKGFFVSSYPSEEQALNNAMSDLATAINNNQTNNTNRIINSVENFGNQLNQNQTQTNEKLTELTDFFKDNTPPQSDYTFAPQFESGGILTNLINLPLSMASTLMNALSNQCVPFTVRLPFVDTDLVIPCISEFMSSIDATLFFEGIGATAGGFILYNYLKYLALLFDKSLRFDLSIKDVI